MSAITIDDELVHYEVLGRGKPILLVHGWLGSWKYWVPTMQQLAVKYRCYALDLWGFGDSGKDPRRYTLESQIDLLNKFIDRMGIPKAVLVGHSLGAAIAAQYAANPKMGYKVHRMLLVAPPLVDVAPLPENTPKALTANTAALPPKTSTSELPTPLTDSQANMPIITAPSPVAQQVTINPANTIRQLFEENTPEDLLSRATDPHSDDFEKLKAEVLKADVEAVRVSTHAFDKVNTFRDLLALQTPICALVGEQDTLLPRPEETLLQQLDALSHVKLIETPTQHFPMLESKAQFVRLLKDFLEAPDLSSLEMKEEWRRRKR